jgi:hypothetical protein
VSLQFCTCSAACSQSQALLPLNNWGGACLQGYEFPEDERVLEGSCGLEYALKRVGGMFTEPLFDEERQLCSELGVASLVPSACVFLWKCQQDNHCSFLDA